MHRCAPAPSFVYPSMMVILMLKTNFFNLIVSIISCVSELLALSALLAFRTHRECSLLERGSKVSVLHSKRRRRQLQACALILFVVLELFLVFSVQPYATLRPISCVAVDTSLRFRSEAHSAQAESAAVDCRTLTRGRFEEHNATYSNTGTIRCGAQTLFGFRMNSTHLFSVALQEQHPSADVDALVVACASEPIPASDNKCLLILPVNNTVYISDLLYTSPPTQFADVRKLPFSATNLEHQPSLPQIRYFGTRAANTLIGGIREPLQFRHRVFSGFRNQTCMERDSDPRHTKVHPAMLAGLILVWLTCFLVAVALYCAKPLTPKFFDMRNPMHWAERTFRTSKTILNKNVAVKLVQLDGTKCVQVCDEHVTNDCTESI